MAGFGFRVNTVFEWDGVQFRMERLQPNGDVLIDRQVDGQLSIVSQQTLLTEYRNGKVSAVLENQMAPREEKPVFGRPLDELSDEVKADLERRKHYLHFIIDQGRPVFTKRYLQPLILAAAEKIGDQDPPSAISIYRWSREYSAANDPRALIPRTDLRGKRGPKQDERVLALLSDATAEAFKASPLATGPTIYSRLLAKIDFENIRTLNGTPLTAPSIRTVYRLLANADAYQLAVLRDGKAGADKRFRQVKGTVVTKHILERVEVDHTPLDLFLIDETTGVALGCPMLTMLIDHFSRMPLGYYLSYNGASAGAVMGALRHAILPKETAERAIPNLKTENAWPCYGRPDLLVVDNGLEFHGLDLDSVAYDLGIRIQYCPKHEPRFKGVIERYLKTINYFFCHQIPGTSFARLHLRGDYDPAKHALLTLAEFKQVVEKWIVDVYAQTVHRSTGMTPWAKWHQGRSSRVVELPSNLRAFKNRIGLVNERSLRRDGVVLAGIRYNGDALGPILRRYGEGIKVRVLYDPEDLGEIQVWGPDDPDPVCVLALDQEYAKGLTEKQNDSIREILREQGAASENKAALQRARAELSQAIDELLASRKQRDRRRAAALKGMSSNDPGIDLKIVSAKSVEPPCSPAPINIRTVTELPSPLSTFQLDQNQGEWA